MKIEYKIKFDGYKSNVSKVYCYENNGVDNNDILSCFIEGYVNECSKDENGDEEEIIGWLENCLVNNLVEVFDGLLVGSSNDGDVFVIREVK